MCFAGGQEDDATVVLTPSAPRSEFRNLGLERQVDRLIEERRERVLKVDVDNYPDSKTRIRSDGALDCFANVN